MGCCNTNENDDNAHKRQWWVRIAVTSLLLLIITSFVFASIFYRATHRKSVKVTKSGDDGLEEKTMTDEKTSANKSAAFNKSGLAFYAEHPFCAETGSKILTKGGSAVDAGIAMLFCQGVVEPHHSGLGGGLIMTIYVSETKEVVSLDARGTAPSLATESMLETYSNVSDDTTDEDNNDINITRSRKEWLTVTVPSEVAGLWEAHKKYGKLEWHYLVDPAIGFASHGFPINPNLAKHLAIYNRTVKRSAQLRKVFINPKTNEFYKEGEVVVNKELSKILMRIASEGVDFIYTGEMANIVAKESFEYGGILSFNDFNDYKVKWSNALSHTFLDRAEKTYTLYMPPPPSYAIMIAMILNIVNGNEKEDSSQDSPSRLARFHHTVVEAMKHTFARKHLFGDSSGISDKIFSKILNAHWGSKVRSLISSTTTFPSITYLRGKQPSTSEDHGTTNVAAVDTEGNVMVASSSLNDPFGSGIVSDTLGFLLNNNMLSFTMTNNGVLMGTDYGNRIHRSKRPSSFLSPLIVLDDNGNFKLAIAASGGSARIITSIALILMRYFWLDQSLPDADANLRFHHQLEPNVLLYEGENKTYTFEYLRSYGHKLEYNSTRWPHVSHIVQENGTLITFSDNREH